VLALVGVAVFATRSPPPGPASALPPDREAAYRALIAEANARIEAQNRALREKRDAAPASEPSPTGPIGADAAGRSALERAPGSRLLSAPELVSYQGQTAYEARLDVGTIYIDAYGGRVLFDGTVRPGGEESRRWLVQNEHGERHHGRRHHEEDDDDD